MTRKRVQRYKRRKPGGKYKVVQVKSYLRKRGRSQKSEGPELGSPKNQEDEEDEEA